MSGGTPRGDGAEARGRLAHAWDILRDACGDRARLRVPLAPLTSFRIGGAAAIYLEADVEPDLEAAGRAVREAGIRWTVVGRGSNLLVSDSGFDGLVIRLGKGFRWAARETRRIRAGGSMPLPALSGIALAHSLAGLEFGVAIPGSLGGAVRMNAGAHARSMQDVVELIEVYSIGRRRRRLLSSEEASFRYRGATLEPDDVVVGATMTLEAGDRDEIRALMEEARAWRRSTQPLAEPNCGSVFKNPPGQHAARLVEAAGAKGLAVGGASVSAKHANFIVAGPGASAGDVLRLVQQVQKQVKDRFDVLLELEVQLVGDFE